MGRMQNKQILKKTLSVSGLEYVETYSFSCGNSVPVFDVFSVHALNQIIGYAKFINKEYGYVLYRGENKLHTNLIPSLFRGCVGTTKWNNVSPLVNKIIQDDNICEAINAGGNLKWARNKVEGMLQHYGVPTRYIDLVDNHWISLWMGLYECNKSKKIELYCHYSRRSMDFLDAFEEIPHTKDELYQYILLVAFPMPNENIDGIKMSEDFIVVDLRQALPSVFLRPHSQHGFVARKKPKINKLAKDYDLATEVIGILRIRIDRASDWLGEGRLLSKENLFPSPMNDYGYDLLLNLPRDFFPKEYKIAKYV